MSSVPGSPSIRQLEKSLLSGDLWVFLSLLQHWDWAALYLFSLPVTEGFAELVGDKFFFFPFWLEFPFIILLL